MIKGVSPPFRQSTLPRGTYPSAFHGSLGARRFLLRGDQRGQSPIPPKHPIQMGHAPTHFKGPLGHEAPYSARSVPSLLFVLIVSFTTVPLNRNNAIRFGIAMSPLNVSAISHINPKSIVAPIMDTKE